MTLAPAAAAGNTRTATVDSAMTNSEIAAVFRDIAARLTENRENIFKIRAYEKAARSIEESTADMETLAKAGRLRDIPGVGDAIEKKITKLVKTGRLEFYERLKAQ